MSGSNQERLPAGGAAVGYKVDKMWADRGGLALEEPGLDCCRKWGRRDRE